MMEDFEQDERESVDQEQEGNKADSKQYVLDGESQYEEVGVDDQTLTKYTPVPLTEDQVERVNALGDVKIVESNEEGEE